jgi:translation initiation factor 3 subunit F
MSVWLLAGWQLLCHFSDTQKKNFSKRGMDSIFHTKSQIQTGPFCKIHPVVVFSILDHYIRRPEGNRVIGTLLGSVSEGFVEISNCFPVPFSEGDEQVLAILPNFVQLGMDMEYHQSTLELYRKASPKEVIVGWYSTGAQVNDNSVLIHDFYAKETGGSTVHMLLDTDISKLKFDIKTFVNTNVSLHEMTLGSQFISVPNEIVGNSADKVGGTKAAIINYFSKWKHSLKQEKAIPTNFWMKLKV